MNNKEVIQTAAVGLSVGTAFLQFIGIVVYNIITVLCGHCKRFNCNCKKADDRVLLCEGEGSLAEYRDSILLESIQMDSK